MTVQHGIYTEGFSNPSSADIAPFTCVKFVDGGAPMDVAPVASLFDRTIGVTGEHGIPAGGWGVVHFGGVVKCRSGTNFKIPASGRVGADGAGGIQGGDGGARSVGHALETAYKIGDIIRVAWRLHDTMYI